MVNENKLSIIYADVPTSYINLGYRKHADGVRNELVKMKCGVRASSYDDLLKLEIYRESNGDRELSTSTSINLSITNVEDLIEGLINYVNKYYETYGNVDARDQS